MSFDSRNSSPVASYVRPRAVPFLAILFLSLVMAFGVSQVSFASASQVADSTPSAKSSTTNSTNGTATFSVADVAAKANPAVVTIYTYTSQTPSTGNGGVEVPSSAPDGTQSADAPAAEQPVGAGSGWIFDDQGHVVTNNHVVEGADSFVVQFADGTQVDATLVGTDQFQDVAVLKLTDGTTLPGIATVGDSSVMRAGDQVVAIGSPLGEFTNSVSEGIVGGLDRKLDTGAGYSIQNLIQHDAPISPGNSGGPLLNMQGEVIGMNVAKVDYQQSGQPSASGLGFAIDGNTVARIATQIISNDGDVVFPFLGITGQETPAGQQVVDVQVGSPADTAGLLAGDVITEVDGVQLDADHLLQDQLFMHQPGDTVTLTIDRGGNTTSIEVTLGERPSNA